MRSVNNKKLETHLPKKIKKENLPQKICQTCQRSFAWRKKWQKVWHEVKYCSDRCRNNKIVKL